jgi:glycyl-tRNA synthetase beta chain
MSPSEARGEYLLEVRSEEIPARMLPGATHELATRLFEELMARGLGPREVETGFTPRRLVVVLRGLPAKEPDQEQDVFGPPVQAAFDQAGNPTPAAEGFARKLQVAVEELSLFEGKAGQEIKSRWILGQLPSADLTARIKQKGLYLGHRQQLVGRPAATVLAELAPRLLRALSWAKTMRWGSGEGHGPWVRPVHGIVSLLDGEVVPWSLFGVAAGNETAGHPVLSPAPFAVSGPEDHRAQLAARGIEARPGERRRRLLAGMRDQAAARGGRLVEDAELLDKLAAVCEIPGVMEGSFAPEFLELPREVLATSLRDHQSALTAEDSSGGLLPAFFTVMDRPDDPQGRVRAGNEWVVAARLADARFFYDEDRKLPLAERARRLEHLTFHERLGSYAAKTERLVALSELLCKELGWAAASGAAAAAARLLKADLTTEMVKEFTSLQGIMGGVYARQEEYPEEVWQALYDQYLPAGTADPLPRGQAGQVTALSDRIDTLAGFFGLGLVPTGSRDPFGLRRAAQGVVRIVLENGLACDLDLAAAAAARLYGERLKRTPEEIVTALRPFLYDRVRHLLELQGFAYDEIEAALAVGGGNLPDLRARVEALHRVREEPAFLAIVLAAKRIANIIRDASEHELEPQRLTEPAERALHGALEELRAEVEDAAARQEYERCLRRVEDLAGALDRFFVEVLVMDEDPAVRRNRLALLQSSHRVLSRAARLTEMVVDKAEHRARGARAAGAATSGGS